MQILLQALIAETSEGRKPTSLIDLVAEDQTLFTEVFDLEGETVETTLEGELGLVDITPDLEGGDATGDLIDGDILLPLNPRAAPKSAPTTIEITPVSLEDAEIVTAQPETDETLETTPRDLSGETTVPVDVGEASAIDDQDTSVDAGIAVPAAGAPSERKEDVARETLVQRPETVAVIAENTLSEKATIAGQQSDPPQIEPLRKSDTLDQAGAFLEKSARAVAPDTAERQVQRDAPLATTRANSVEVETKGETLSSREVLPRADVVAARTVEVVQNSASPQSAAIQTASVAAPVAQLLAQVEKGHQRDAILGPDALATAATSGDDEVKQTTTGQVRAEPAVRPLMSQVAQLALRAAADGVVEVRLQPEELGRLRIAMTQLDTGIVVQVSAERPETLDLLRRNIDLLERDLREQGFDNPSFSFGEGTADTRQDHDGAHEATEATHTNTHIEIDVHPKPMVASDGRLDIRL